SILIHMHRALWRWAAIIRTVRRGTPGTLRDHSSTGRFSMRYIVTRLFVCHAAIRPWPSWGSLGTLARLDQGLSDAGLRRGRCFRDTERMMRWPRPVVLKGTLDRATAAATSASTSGRA